MPYPEQKEHVTQPKQQHDEHLYSFPFFMSIPLPLQLRHLRRPCPLQNRHLSN